MQRKITWPLAAIISLGLAILSINASCTRNQRMSTINASFVTVNTARDEFFTWDLEHRRKLLGESKDQAEFDAKTAAYDAKFAKVIGSLELTYKALLFAATKSDEFSMSAATAAVTELFQTISQFKKSVDVRDGSSVPGDPPPPAKDQ